MTRSVQVGGIAIGGGAPVSIQSMTNTDTRDVEATLAQIRRLAAAGCEIVRVSVYDDACAEAVARFADKGTKHFFLAHLSQENNRPELALDCVRKATAGTDATVEVLPVYGEKMIAVKQ